MDQGNPDRSDQRKSVNYVRGRKRKGRYDCRRGRQDPAGVERKHFFHDTDAIGKCDRPHCGACYYLRSMRGANQHGNGKEQSARRCMLIARTFKSSLLQRWSAHLWQNGMTQAPV